jgi:hypothetical protein
MLSAYGNVAQLCFLNGFNYANLITSVTMMSDERENTVAAFEQ